MCALVPKSVVCDSESGDREGGNSRVCVAFRASSEMVPPVAVEVAKAKRMEAAATSVLVAVSSAAAKVMEAVAATVIAVDATETKAVVEAGSTMAVDAWVEWQ